MFWPYLPTTCADADLVRVVYTRSGGRGGEAVLGAGWTLLADAPEKASRECLISSLLKRRHKTCFHPPVNCYVMMSSVDIVLPGLQSISHKGSAVKAGKKAHGWLLIHLFMWQISVFEEMKYLEIMIVSDHSMVSPFIDTFLSTVLLPWLRLPLAVSLQYKRHKTKQHTRNFAKSVVNLVDAVSKIFPPFRPDLFFFRGCVCCSVSWTNILSPDWLTQVVEPLAEWASHRSSPIRVTHLQNVFSNIGVVPRRNPVQAF